MHSSQNILTAKLRLLHSPEQKAALDVVSLAYRDGLNYASQVAFEHGKTSSQNKLQKLTYPRLRARGIPAQMACNIARTVGATYKGLWTKAKQNAKDRTAGLTPLHPELPRVQLKQRLDLICDERLF